MHKSCFILVLVLLSSIQAVAGEKGRFRSWSISGRIAGTSSFLHSFSNDGQKVLVIDPGKSALVYKTHQSPTGQTPLSIPASFKYVTYKHFQFTPDSNAVLIFEPHRLVKWSLPTLKEEVLVDSIDPQNGNAMNEEMTLALVRAQASSKWELWHICPQPEFLKSFNEVAQASFSKDGIKLAIQFSDPMKPDNKIVEIWDTQKLEDGPIFRTSDWGTLSGFSPDNRYVSFWHPLPDYLGRESYYNVYALDHPFKEPIQTTLQWQITSDSRYSYSGETTVQAGYPRGASTTLAGTEIVDYSPTNQLFLVRSKSDGHFWIYSFTMNGKKLEAKRKKLHHVHGSYGIFSKNGQRLVIATKRRFKVYRIHNLREPEFKINRVQPSYPIETRDQYDVHHRLRFSDDGRSLYLKGDQNDGHLWELNYFDGK